MQSDEIFLIIENHFKSNLPFVIYRKPDLSEVNVILQKDRKMHLTEDYSESGFVFAPFDDKQRTILIPLSNSDIHKFTPNTTIKTEVSIKDIHQDQSGKNQHIALVKKGIISIKKGVFQKSCAIQS